MDYNQYPGQQYPVRQYPVQQYPVQQYPVQQIDHRNDVLSPGQFVGMFLLSSIPIVRLICWIVWLFGDDVNRNKKNYVIGSIIYGLIVTLVTVVSIFILTAVLGISYADLANSVY